MNQLVVTDLDTPIGMISVMATTRGICYVTFQAVEDAMEELLQWSGQRIGTPESVEITVVSAAENEWLQDAENQFRKYFAKELRVFDLPLDPKGTPFQLKVWEALSTIPYGETCSYKEIARRIGQPKAVRAVGGANNRNPLSIIVPCHRVIGVNGNMVGYGGGLDRKITLLSLEQTK